MEMRYFLIGFVVSSKEGYHTFETLGTSFLYMPSLDECYIAVSKDYTSDLDVSILSLSEFSKEDFDKLFEVE